MNNIREMNIQDIDVVVNIHMNAFPGFFLSFLGKQFLYVFYHSLLLNKSKIAFVYEEHAIQAFVTGTTHPSDLYKQLLRQHWWEFAWASVGALLKKPYILPRLINAFHMPDRQLPKPDCATLISIAVYPTCQGHGIGKKLVDYFLKEATRLGCRFISLVTDALNNESANAFYISVGFKLYRSYKTLEGRIMNEYLIDL